MNMIEWPEWIVIAIVALLCVYLLYQMFTVGDGLDDGDDGPVPNSNATAIDMFLDLVNDTQEELTIHDDGNDFPGSLYGDEMVIAAIRKAVLNRKIKVRCLFNCSDQPEAFLELARSDDVGTNIEIWHLNEKEHEPDTHYKIVDNGKVLHTSFHKLGEEERLYRIRNAKRFFEFATRRRIRERYRDHFSYNIQLATRAA